MSNDKLDNLVIDDTHYQTQLTRKFKMRKKYVPHNPKHILAFIPGTIRELYVREGQNVRKNDNLLVLEAMKMRNTMTSPFDGTIKRIYIQSEVSVPKNHLLIEFE